MTRAEKRQREVVNATDRIRIDRALHPTKTSPVPNAPISESEIRAEIRRHRAYEKRFMADVAATLARFCPKTETR
jgi:hypothetical protein